MTEHCIEFYQRDGSRLNTLSKLFFNFLLNIDSFEDEIPFHLTNLLSYSFDFTFPFAKKINIDTN